jgi:hypothetical protein
MQKNSSASEIKENQIGSPAKSDLGNNSRPHSII